MGRNVVMNENMGSTTNFDVMLTPKDERYRLMERGGISLFDSLSYVPNFGNVLRNYGGVDRFVRGEISRLMYSAENVTRYSGPANVKILVHPASTDLFNGFQNRMLFKVPIIDKINLIDYGGGGEVTIDIEEIPFEAADFPNTSNTNERKFVFWDGNEFMNEFGYIYVSLHILGNFARYYPDLWMKAVEQSHPIATVTERFLELVEVRMPMAALSEISRSYHLECE